MQLELVKVSQDFNLDTRQMENFIVLKLPAGELVRLPVPEEVVNQIVHAAMGTQPKTRSETSSTSEVSYDLGPTEFGGDFVAANGISQEQPQPIVEEPCRAPRVEKDSYGYPIVQGRGGIDPGELTGGTNTDEDGVGSV